ncbi:MAG: nucleoside deaminase [Bacteroidales bacterium]|nr:nucleoside deaminase [Bacteroidales bacterium]
MFAKTGFKIDMENSSNELQYRIIEGTREVFSEPERTHLGHNSKKTSPPTSPQGLNLYAEIITGSNKWIERACELAAESAKTGGGPFGAIVLQIDSETSQILRLWEAWNSVTCNNDPTAHAEINAIRAACASLRVYNLGKIPKSLAALNQPGEWSHCIILSSCEPCPMCYSAIAWARIPELYFAATRFDAAQPGVGFSDEAIYDDLRKPYSKRLIKVYKCNAPNSLNAFQVWKQIDKQMY